MGLPVVAVCFLAPVRTDSLPDLVGILEAEGSVKDRQMGEG